MRVSADFLALCLAPLALATHLRILIATTPLLPHPGALPASTHAQLTTLGHVYTAPLRADNTFDFRNVTSGSYLLDVYSHTYAFVPLRVDVHEGVKQEGGVSEVEVFGTFRGNEWGNKGEVIPVTEVEGDAGVWAFEVKALGIKEYFVERSGFNPMSLLKNPMILIAGVSMILVFGMPYIMDNMDPEMKAEFEQQQKKTSIGNPAANPLQNFDAAAWLAGSSSKKTESPASVARRGERPEGAITR